MLDDLEVDKLKENLIVIKYSIGNVHKYRLIKDMNVL